MGNPGYYYCLLYLLLALWKFILAYLKVWQIKGV